MKQGLLAAALLWVSACEETTPAAPGIFLLGSPADGATVSAPSFSWSPSLGATHYVLEVEGEDPREVDGTTAQLTLPAGESRSWRVSAVGPGGNALAANAPFHFTVAPDAPAAFTLVSPAADATRVELWPTFRWTASAGAARYVLQVGTDEALTAPAFELGSLPPTATSAVLEGPLAPGTRWFWRVLAEDSVQTTATAAAAFATAELPGDFALLAPASGATDLPLTPAFSWSASSGADGYTFELDSAALELDGTTFAPATPLGSATSYSWRVVAHNAQGTRERSASFTTGTGPGDFTVVSPARGEIGVSVSPTLSWSASAAATTYSVQLGTTRALDLPPVFEDDAVSSTSVAVPGPLAPATTYYWRIVALDAAASVVATGAPFSFTTAPPPTAPVLSSPFDGAIDLPVATPFGWLAPMFASSQTLEIASDSAFTNIVYRNATLDGSAAGMQLPLAASLAGSTTYYWRVTASGPAGSAVASNAPWSFTTGVVPSPFTLLTPFTWTAAAGAVRYEVQVGTDPAFGKDLFIDQLVAGVTSYTPPAACPLAPSTTYSWRVLAIGPAGVTVATNAPQPYQSPSSGGGGSVVWAVTHPTANPPAVGQAFAVDATGVYDAVAADGLWHVEKRSPVDGTLLWDQVLSLPNATPVALVLGATDAWVVSNVFNGPIRIEKRELATGALVQGFGVGGIVESNLTFYDHRAVAAASDGTWLYIAGTAAGSFYLELRALDTGASGGFSMPDTTNEIQTGAVLVPPSLYVLGRNTLVDEVFGTPLDTQWRIEVRDPSDGGLTGSFDVNPSDADDDPSVLLAGPDGLYLTGDDRTLGEAQWHIEKRALDGTLLFTATSDPSGFDDKVLGAAIDGASLYVVGSSNLQRRWRVEALDSATGAHLPTWGAGGVVECQRAANRNAATAVAVDATGVYVLGVESDTATTGFRWSVEKRRR